MLKKINKILSSPNDQNIFIYINLNKKYIYVSIFISNKVNNKKNPIKYNTKL